MTLSDRIVVMKRRTHRAEGTPEEVYQRPRSDRHGLSRPRQPSGCPHRERRRRKLCRVEESGCSMPVAGGSWSVGQEVLLASARGRRGAGGEHDGEWVGVVRASVYVSGHVEYVVEWAKFTVGRPGPEDARLPHDARAEKSSACRRGRSACGRGERARTEGQRDDEPAMGRDDLGGSRVIAAAGARAGARCTRRASRRPRRRLIRRRPPRVQAAMAEWKSKIVPRRRRKRGHLVKLRSGDGSRGHDHRLQQGLPGHPGEPLLSPGFSWWEKIRRTRSRRRPVQGRRLPGGGQSGRTLSLGAACAEDFIPRPRSIRREVALAHQ